MQVTGTPSVLAPLSTGHPGALPETPKKAAETGLIKPPGSGTGASGTQERPFRHDGRAEAKKDRAAPPSALQIEIEAMLAEQAEELAELKQQITDGALSE
ncbi:MAG: hypothetical protein ABJI96_03500 [Paracoccaceae bacterium]